MTQVTHKNAKEILVIKNIPLARSLAAQFLAFQLMVVAVVLIAVAAVSVALSTSEFREARGTRMIAVAENMASTPIVRERIERAPADPFASRILAPEVDRAVALSGATLAEILAPDGTVWVSSAPSRVGARVDLGAEPRRRRPGLVRRRGRRRQAQPGRAGADPVPRR